MCRTIEDELALLARTDWFVGEVPAHVGVYEVITYSGYLGWSWWTGEHWGECWPEFNSCAYWQGYRYSDRGFHWVKKWRGQTVVRPKKSSRKAP